MNKTNQTRNTDLLSNSKFEGQKLVACSPQLLKSKAILSACQTDITRKEEVICLAVYLLPLGHLVYCILRV